MRAFGPALLTLLLAACAEQEAPAPLHEAPAPAPRSPDELAPPEEPPDPVEASGAFVAALHSEALRARDGRGVERDPARAAQMLQRACDDGFVPSCLALAEMLEAGEGVPADPDRARGLIEQACHAGSTLACDRLGH